MATIQNMYNNRCLEEIRGTSQVNPNVWLAWYKKGLLIFQKMVLEYVSGQQNTESVIRDIDKDTATYTLPLGESGNPDFYSIIQLRVAYHTDKNWNPIYRVCKPISLTDYNIAPTNNKWETDSQWEEHLVARGWSQKGSPRVWDRISERFPRYVFVNKNTIKIFPTPTEDVDNGLFLNYNYIQDTDSITMNTNINSLNLPWYFFDAIEDYITFRLYQAENPEQAQWYYQQFESTLHDNIYWLNKDKRPIEESFADTRCFSHY